jgi:hypothetical protein
LINSETSIPSPAHAEVASDDEESLQSQAVSVSVSDYEGEATSAPDIMLFTNMCCLALFRLKGVGDDMLFLWCPFRKLHSSQPSQYKFVGRNQG